MSKSINGRALAALLIAGFGWGTTGLFVKVIGQYGASVYELLLLRLIVTFVIMIVILIPIFLRRQLEFGDRRRKQAILALGASMVFYYLGAITAFTHLKLVIAALVVGSSPLVAWLLPFFLERRLPRKSDLERGVGVGTALIGLILLIFTKDAANSARPSAVVKATVPWLGYVGGLMSAFVTVLNARFLNHWKQKSEVAAPSPIEITLATVFIGVLLGGFGALIFPAEISFEKIAQLAMTHSWLAVGFGLLATAIPGLCIAYASVWLPPQATATVSIQIQVWSGVLAWVILGESMTILQIVAALLILLGSWLCVRRST